MKAVTRVYEGFVDRIPILRRAKRRYRNFDKLVIIGVCTTVLGLCLGAVTAVITSGQGGTSSQGIHDLNDAKTWLRQSFAPTIPVAGAQRDGTFVLANFESMADFRLWKLNAAKLEPSMENVMEGSHSARVTFFADAKLAGVSIEEYFRSKYGVLDWSDYRELGFYVYNPQDKPLRLILQVKDRWGSAYKQDIRLMPHAGALVSAPVSKIAGAVKIDRIDQVTLFVWEDTGQREFYLDYFHLVPGRSA